MQFQKLNHIIFEVIEESGIGCEATLLPPTPLLRGPEPNANHALYKQSPPPLGRYCRIGRFILYLDLLVIHILR